MTSSQHSTTCTLVAQWDIGATLGESVIWDDRVNRFYWTDIENRCLYIFQWGEKAPVKHTLPARLASFGLTKDSDILFAAFDYGLAWLNLRDLSVQLIVNIEAENPNTRLNDGRMDRQGRFWVGSMFNKVTADTIGAGNLYKYSGLGELSIHREGIVIPNSLAWSPSGEKMYFADSKTFRIDQYDFDKETGIPSNPKIFATLNKGIHADGSCVDADGCLWNAQWGNGQVVRYAENGDAIFHLDLPTVEPTCVGFGGPDLDHLCVVTANLGGHNAQRPSIGNGSVYLFKTSVKGLIEPRFSQRPQPKR